MTPTHWALVWNPEELFFEKSDFCRVKKNAAVSLGHKGERCPRAATPRTFTLVDRNGIHATIMVFCECRSEGGQRIPDFEQLLRAGIFPGSVSSPKTGYTLRLLEYYRDERNQGKGSAYNFFHVLQRMSDPFFAESVPVHQFPLMLQTYGETATGYIYANFLAITPFHQYLDIKLQRGHAHDFSTSLGDATDRPYPHRPTNFLGQICAACPEPGINMPLAVSVPRYMRYAGTCHSHLA